MTQKRASVVKEHSSLKKLDEMIKKLEIDVRVLERLYFIRFLYKGMDVPEASDFVGVSKGTGYNWLKLWNKGGYKALIPNFAGGKPPKLSENEIKELKNLLKDDQFTTKEVHGIIKEKFGVDYSLSQIRRILKSMGMKYGKPYTKDYRKPKNADKILKKKLTEAKITKNNNIIGFADEMGINANPNTVKFWYFKKKPRKIATYIKTKTT